MSERRRDWLQGGVFFLLLMARNCSCGLRYWPQLDDYIQYHNYAAGFTFPELQETVGLLASRPFAGLADYFVWSPMFEGMLLAVALLSALYALSAVLMKRLLERYFAIGPLFLPIMALLPLGVEGTYWVSASSRVVVGLFFACLAAMAFGGWLDHGTWPRALLFMTAMVIPFGFYEQSAVLAMTLVLGMALLELREKKMRTLLALWVVPAALLYFAVTGMLSNGGVYASRMELVLPVSDYYWNTFLPEGLSQLKAVFVEGNFYTLAKGFLRVMRMEALRLWLLLPITLGSLYGFLVWKQGGAFRPKRTALALLSGFLLTLAPVTLFLILANPWFSFRGAVTSFAGIALFCDTLVMALWRYLPARRVGTAVLAGLAAAVFCIAGASEVADYRDTYISDQRAASAVLEAFERDELFQSGLRVGILGLEATHLPDQNYHWHEHITGCTESNWAFTGLLVSRAGEGAIPSVQPLPTWPLYKRWNAQINYPAGFDRLYWYDGSRAVPVVLETTGEKAYDVLLADGTPLGRIWEERDGLGYFELLP